MVLQKGTTSTFCSKVQHSCKQDDAFCAQPGAALEGGQRRRRFGKCFILPQRGKLRSQHNSGSTKRPIETNKDFTQSNLEGFSRSRPTGFNHTRKQQAFSERGCRKNDFRIFVSPRRKPAAKTFFLVFYLLD